jgi:predicted nucleic acid-binding protein
VKVFFDTSVLVAAMLEKHPHHGRALPWLRQAARGEVEFLVAAHSMAEMYSVLTTYPARPRISPSSARRLIRDNVEKTAKVVSLAAADYASVLERMSELGLAGGAVYDALLARAAEKAAAERLLTFNPGDFARVWPRGEALLHVP